MINKEEIQKILTKSWTQFIDYVPLFANTLKSVNSHTLPIVKKSEIPQKNSVQISVSQIYFLPTGLKVWVEFLVPREKDTVDIGTVEAIISWEGEFAEQYVIGNRFVLAHEAKKVN